MCSSRISENPEDDKEEKSNITKVRVDNLYVMMAQNLEGILRVKYNFFLTKDRYSYDLR
jgi:hypothetical protein